MSKPPRSSTAVRPWCAKASFPGLKPFVGGTVIASADLQSHEIEALIDAHFRTFLPPGFKIIEPMCGSLFIHEEDA
jgi:hypothetical protein